MLRLAGRRRTGGWIAGSVRVCVCVCGYVCLYVYVRMCEYVFVCKNIKILCFVRQSRQSYMNDLISYAFQEKSLSRLNSKPTTYCF